MVVIGCVNGKDITIMIDLGAMQNFIALKVVEWL